MGSRWVYDVKKDGKGNWICDKARLIGKGFTQQLGVDYHKTWVVVAQLKSIRITAVIATSCNLYLWQINFEAAYLNSTTKEEI